MASISSDHGGENKPEDDKHDKVESKQKEGSSDDESCNQRRKRRKRKKTKRKFHDTSSSSDSYDTDDEDRRNKKRRRKDKKKQKKKKKRKDKKREDDSSSDEVGVRRSIISGKKIQMRIDKTEDDLAQDKARKEFLRFMNSSVWTNLVNAIHSPSFFGTCSSIRPKLKSDCSIDSRSFDLFVLSHRRSQYICHSVYVAYVSAWKCISR